MTSHSHARPAALALAGLLLLGACAARPDVRPPADPSRPAALPTSGLASSGPPATPSHPPTSPGAGCGPDTIESVRAALAAVDGYRYTASGIVPEEVYPADPGQSPTTRQVAIAFEGAYQAPDRGLLRYTGGAPDGEPVETRTIGPDLWVLTEDGWQSLPGAVTSEGANVIAALVDDAGEDWTASAEPASAGGGCRLVARQPTSDGTGARELALRIDPASGMPTVLRAEVRGALDRRGDRQDSHLEYEVTVDPSISVDRPD
jgi:hypothetical protein